MIYLSLFRTNNFCNKKVMVISDIIAIIKHHKTHFNWYFSPKGITFCGVMMCFIVKYMILFYAY